MRGGYLAIVERAAGRPGREKAEQLCLRTAALTGLRRVFQSDGLTVFADESLPFIRTVDAIILGTVFDRDTSARQAGPDKDILWSRVREEGPAILTREFWGAYVAMIDHGEEASVEILRDPLAGLPCHYSRSGDVTLVFSHIGLLIALGIELGGFDWASLRAHLLFEHFRPPQTALAGVVELIGGTRLQLRCGECRVLQDWSPWTFAARNHQLADPEEAIDTVGRTTAQCVQAWASCFRHVLLGVSGGLDSSIVAACLAGGPTSLTCLTVATTDPAGDERGYSRELAEALDLDLREAFEDVEQVDPRTSRASHLPRPVARAFAQSSDQAFRTLAEALDADAYFNGGGGDNVFCYLTSGAPIADRLLTGGGWSSALATARDMGRMTGSSTFRALRLGLERAYLRSPRYRWPRNDMWLGERGHETAPIQPDHPWLEAKADSLPGKAAHIAWILGIQNYLEGYGRELEKPIISPLLSQPLVELCLRIPTWMWCMDSRDRAVARRAFAKRLPASVIDRLVKGSPGSFEVEIFERRRGEIRDMLADGILVREGLIDRDAVLAAIDSRSPLGAKEHNRIMAFVDVEAWLTCWASRF